MQHSVPIFCLVKNVRKKQCWEDSFKAFPSRLSDAMLPKTRWWKSELSCLSWTVLAAVNLAEERSSIDTQSKTHKHWRAMHTLEENPQTHTYICAFMSTCTTHTEFYVREAQMVREGSTTQCQGGRKRKWKRKQGKKGNGWGKGNKKYSMA